MPYYIALIHKDANSGYGVSFPDLPGVVTAADTIDEALRKAPVVLEFAADDWRAHTGSEFPAPRSIDELRADLNFQEDAVDAVIAAIPFRAKVDAAEQHTSQ